MPFCRKRGGGIGPALDKFGGAVSPVILAKALWNHGPQMDKMMRSLGISRPTFSGREMIHLLSYLRSVSYRRFKQKIYVVPGNPEEGEKQFNQKGCIICHRTGGIGPNLMKKKLSKSVTEIAGDMWDHGPRMWENMRKSGISIPRFSGNEMADLLAYLYFLRYMDTSGDENKGEKVFEEKGCFLCHSIRGEWRGNEESCRISIICKRHD